MAYKVRNTQYPEGSLFFASSPLGFFADILAIAPPSRQRTRKSPRQRRSMLSRRAQNVVAVTRGKATTDRVTRPAAQVLSAPHPSQTSVPKLFFPIGNSFLCERGTKQRFRYRTSVMFSLSATFPLCRPPQLSTPCSPQRIPHCFPRLWTSAFPHWRAC